jgi:hypothetical protein
MKYLIMPIACLLFLTGCETNPPVKEIAPPINTVIDLDDEDLDDELLPLDEEEIEEPLYSGKCLFNYGRTIANSALSAEDREWEGYHKLGNKAGKVPTRMLFSTDGNIKMYTKPIATEDWQLVKNFNVDRLQVATDDENIDDIISFPKAVNYCLFYDTKENANKDFPCITLYPEGMPIQANSPFNIKVCTNPSSSITVNMLKHEIFLSLVTN